jgi:DNA processing protein
MSCEDELPYEAWIVALMTLPKMGPARLNEVLDHHEAQDAWNRLRSGASIGADRLNSETINGWRSASRQMSVVDHWTAIHSLGVNVLELGSAGYPERLRHDIEPPQVLFGLGHPVPATPTVGIVGTRNCTAYGKRCAFELGSALAEAGVSVVSGLALGIDSAAHQGALSATGEHRGLAMAIVGSGLDIIYPYQNRGLWGRVSNEGVLLSETPPGVGPERWRFPARNRIIAGLSDALIVIESHERGGSLITVDEAMLRDVPVGAVPGPITSKSAAGSNRLLVDGATPILDVADVLGLIGHTPPRDVGSLDKDDLSSAILETLGWTSQSLEQLCARVTLSVTEVAAEVERLVGLGICRRSGPWIERVR